MISMARGNAEQAWRLHRTQGSIFTPASQPSPDHFAFRGAGGQEAEWGAGYGLSLPMMMGPYQAVALSPVLSVSVMMAMAPTLGGSVLKYLLKSS